MNGFELITLAFPDFNMFMENGIDTGRIIMNNDVPPGSGLGSSSALINGIIKQRLHSQIHSLYNFYMQLERQTLVQETKIYEPWKQKERMACTQHKT